MRADAFRRRVCAPRDGQVAATPKSGASTSDETLYCTAHIQLAKCDFLRLCRPLCGKAPPFRAHSPLHLLFLSFGGAVPRRMLIPVSAIRFYPDP
jgi:hypothetical protein